MSNRRDFYFTYAGVKTVSPQDFSVWSLGGA